jgi:transcriptional regulator MraZ
VFSGQYRVAVDDKGRIAIPVRFRADFDTGGSIGKWLDPCLALHPRAAWEGIENRVDPLPFTDGKARDLQRFLHSSTFPIELDKQGRLVVPPPLRDFAGLTGSEAILVGSGARLELWAPDRWSEWTQRMDAPGFLEEQFRGLGI